MAKYSLYDVDHGCGDLSICQFAPLIGSELGYRSTGKQGLAMAVVGETASA